MTNSGEPTQNFDAIVVGGGPVGWISALALIRAGFKTALVAPALQNQDHRTIALMQGSLKYLISLGLLPEEMPDATRMETMRLVDATGRLIRAPEVAFEASEIGFPYFALNIPVKSLVESVKKVLSDQQGFTLVDGVVKGADFSECTKLTLANDQFLTAKMIVAADGKNSKTRELSGIVLKHWDYPQIAFITQFNHSKPHQNTSTEFHTKTGPFTLVPLQGNRSSLVWVETPEYVEKLLSMDDAALCKVIENQSSFLVGRISKLEKRQSFPMSAQVAARMGRGPVFLVGESGHAFPPIGAQGLNLGIRDIESMIKSLGSNALKNNVIQSNQYAEQRKVDVTSRTFGVDLLNRSLLTGFLPAQLIRAIGLFTAGNISSIRKQLMHQGIAISPPPFKPFEKLHKKIESNL